MNRSVCNTKPRSEWFNTNTRIVTPLIYIRAVNRFKYLIPINHMIVMS